MGIPASLSFLAAQTQEQPSLSWVSSPLTLSITTYLPENYSCISHNRQRKCTSPATVRLI